MCCPRCISDLSSKIGLGHIGPKVRRIIKSARFPVLITSPVYKEWHRIAVFFGANAVKALKLGFRISRTSGMPVDVFTQMGNGYRNTLEKVIRGEGLESGMESYANTWHNFEKGRFEENLYEVPHDTLVVLGAYGHGLIKDFLFGSKMEKIQSTITNNLLIAGANYTTPSI